jgi:diacylglycerol kinase (ATP)
MRSLYRIARSFGFAFEGLAYLLRTQPNFWVHCLAAVFVLLLSTLVGISGAELATLVLVIGLVLYAEAMNSAIEACIDLASPGYHPIAKIAKDASAAAVLITAFTAVGAGSVILLPRLLSLLTP